MYAKREALVAPRPLAYCALRRGEIMKPIVFVSVILAVVFLSACGGSATPTSTPARTLVPTPTPTSTPTSSTAAGFSRGNPVPMGRSLVTEGIEITVVRVLNGAPAWELLSPDDLLNEPPAPGMKYVLVTVKVRNVSSSTEPYSVDYFDFSLVGSSNIAFNPFDILVFLPDTGDESELSVSLYRGGEKVGSIAFYVPENETGLVLVSSLGFSLAQENLRYFELK